MQILQVYFEPEGWSTTTFNPKVAGLRPYLGGEATLLLRRPEGRSGTHPGCCLRQTRTGFGEFKPRTTFGSGAKHLRLSCGEVPAGPQIRIGFLRGGGFLRNRVLNNSNPPLKSRRLITESPLNPYKVPKIEHQTAHNHRVTNHRLRSLVQAEGRECYFIYLGQYNLGFLDFAQRSGRIRPAYGLATHDI